MKDFEGLFDKVEQIESQEAELAKRKVYLTGQIVRLAQQEYPQTKIDKYIEMAESMRLGNSYISALRDCKKNFDEGTLWKDHIDMLQLFERTYMGARRSAKKRFPSWRRKDVEKGTSVGEDV